MRGSTVFEVVGVFLVLMVLFPKQARADERPARDAEAADSSRSAGTLSIPAGSGITIDGAKGDTEWADAARVRISAPEGRIFLVHVKHAGGELLVGFEGFEDVDEWYPEVLLDVELDRASSWQADDWWFHASYSDCASRGRFNDYSTCRLEVSGWKAYNCGTDGSGEGEGHPEMIEMAIPFGTLGLEAGSGARIGIAFDVTDTDTRYHFFPAAAKLADPSTWATAVIE